MTPDLTTVDLGRTDDNDICNDLEKLAGALQTHSKVSTYHTEVSMKREIGSTS